MIYGMEAEVEAHFGGLKLNAGVNALKSSLGEFFAQRPAAAGDGCVRSGEGGPGANCIALEGRDQTYAPNFTFNAGAEYRIQLGENDDAHATDQLRPYRRRSGRRCSKTQRSATGSKRVTSSTPSSNAAIGTLAVTAYATNLTNQHYPGALNSGLYFAGPPRQYGVKVMKTF